MYSSFIKKGKNGKKEVKISLGTVVFLILIIIILSELLTIKIVNNSNNYANDKEVKLPDLTKYTLIEQ